MEDVKDVSNIQDEDVLRRMWHETTDSSEKKVIRSHMYRLREARLKEFYSTGEVLKDVQRSNSSPGLRPEPFKDQGPNHAESLADQSFLSLKSKEIRDSESPTREVQYRNSKNRENDAGWTISTSVDISPDGKTTTRSQTATTSGSRPLEGGQLSYAAANQHQVSVHSDGDDQNYTRSLGEASSTFQHQEAVQGDDNNFSRSQTTTKTSSKKIVSSSRQQEGNMDVKMTTGVDDSTFNSTKSSSKIVQQSESSTKFSGQDHLDNIQTSRTVYSETPQIQSSKIQDGNSTTTITKTRYTTGEIPADLEKSIADGNTKVYTETKTLPDGSTITTTRYETIGSKKISSGTSKQSSTHQTVEQKSSTNQQSSTSGNNTIVTTKTHEIVEPIRITKQQQYNDEITSVTNEKIEQDRINNKVTKVTKTIEDQVPQKTKEVTTVTKTVTEEVENKNQDKPTRSRIEKCPENIPQDIEKVKSCRPEESYRPSSPTDGQYSTTYRSEFTNKKISVDISATHDAFARSLRSISPDRLSERPKSRSSTTSLRSSTSPEKYRPERKSPEKNRPDSINLKDNRRSKSPERFVRTPTSPTKTEKKIQQSPRSPTKSPVKDISPVQRTEKPRGGSPIKSPVKDISPVYRSPASPTKDINTDTITRKKKTIEQITETIVNSDTLTKKKKPETIITVNTETITRKKKPENPPETSGNVSPTSLASDIEFINHNSHIVTDLDDIQTPEIGETIQTKTFDQVCEVTPEKSKDRPPLKRTETYEERCRQILGLSEPEKVSKKEYIDMYAGMEPVEEPMVVKKFVAPLNPDDDLMAKTMEKIRKRKPENVNPEDFIQAEKHDNVETIKKDRQSPERKIPIRKSPEKSPERRPTAEGQYNTEYTDEFIKKPSEKPIRSSPERKPVTTKDAEYNTEYNDEFYKKPTKKPSKPSSPERKSPTRKPSEGKYNTEYVDEYCKEPQKPSNRKPSRDSPEKPQKNVIGRKPSSPERKPSAERRTTSPEKQKPQRTISVAETVIITDRKPKQATEKPQKTVVKTTKPLKETPKPSRKDEIEFSTEYTDEYCEISDKYIPKKPAGISTEPRKNDISPVRGIPEVSTPKKVGREPERVSPSRQSPGLPDNKSVTEYINDYCKTTSNDFINKEKYETDVTLETSPNIPGYMRPIAKISPEERDQIILETRKRESLSPERRTTLEEIDFNLEKENIQENIIRTHRIDTKICDRDVSPKRQIQKAVPSETMECSIKIEEKKRTDVKKPQKKEILEERKSPVKQIKKDTTNKVTSKNVTKVQEKKKPIKERSPERLETKIIPRKISQKDIIIKKQPSKPHTTPTKSEPSKPITKPISAVNKPSTPVKTPVKQSPKTTKPLQPSSTITTSVKTTKTTKNTIQPDIDSSDSETETSRRIVTTTNIKLSTKPSVTMPTIKVNKEKTNCITTKTIVLNNDTEQEFIIDLQRSTSSREPSPDKICPIPVSSEDESNYPRYPDQVSEPDDVPNRHKPIRISDVPLTEGEDVKNFSRITEVITDSRNRINGVDMVQETDDSLLTVTEKVSKFINTAEKLTEDEPRLKTPAPKVPRPELVVDENLENDECLLSVSDKVSKFITTAEQTKVTERSKSPQPFTKEPVEIKVNENDECLLSVNQKVTHFIQAAKDSKQTTVKENRCKTPRPEFSVDESLKKDECLLSVSDKVNKFLSTAEKLTTTPKSETIPKRTSPEKTIPHRSPSPEKTPRTEIPYRRESPVKPETILRRTSPEKTIPQRSPSPEKITRSEIPIRRESPVRKIETERPKSEPSKPMNLKSSEAVKKAKEMFENISKTTEICRQKNILSRPSIWEAKNKEDVNLRDIGVFNKKDEVKKQLIYDENNSRKISSNKDFTLKSTKLILDSPKSDISRSRSPNLPDRSTLHPDRSRSRSKSPNPENLPGYMRPIQKISPEERDQIILETRHREIHSQEKDIHKYENGDIPHYMLPLQRQCSPERIIQDIVTTEIITERSPTPEKEVPGYMRPLQRQVQTPERDQKTPKNEIDDGSRAEKKFGVTLRRTDSGRVVTTTTTSSVSDRRRSSTSGQLNIEEIMDLDVLEKMMDKVIGYEQRRRIRAQIRVVKKLISENKIQKRPKVSSSPMRETPDRKSPVRDIKRSTLSPTKTVQRQKSPEIRSKIDKVDTKIESKSSYSISTKTERSGRSERTITSSKERSISPEPKKLTQKSSQIYKPDLKHVQLSSKAVQDDKPSWVTNRNLKKAEEKRTTTMVKKTDTRRSPSPQKDAKPIDCITSSYGIGPTDENGQPLFGIKALRKAADSKVQIRGTVVTSQYYSENDQEPIGEITVTKYSNNPKELNVNDEQINKSKGLASVTTTQKFGQKGTPTFTSIIDKKKSITDKEDELFKTTSKVNRRGSVKALSQKFIENQVDLSREKQTYPKAGLILRTSSFKETNEIDRNNSSRDSSPGYQSSREKISLESITTDKKSVQESSSSTKTFLNSHTKVANAQEVITRMKNSESEHQEGDSAEDREARMLLNKFLGAQVLMSGMEPLLSGKSSLTSSSQLVRKVQKTTVKESSKPVSITKRFQTPITVEVLQDIWDEKTLRALLEQCTDYEERRAIRARLRQVMAEQEAVAQVVSSAMDDRSHERIETTKKSVTEGPVTTTQVSSTRVVEQRQVSKPISPFAKFRQLDKQNSLTTPPSSPRSTGITGPLFKFTDPAVCQSAATLKERLLHWCQMKTKEYQNIKLENFSTSWADGMAFCALIHHFLPDAFDYHALNPKQRRHNFTLAFKVADEQAGIFPLLDVDDMVAMRRPDWKCVFTYVQSIYRRFKDDD